MTQVRVAVQEADFNVGNEYQRLVDDNSADGAVVTFVGRVRELNEGHRVSTLELEHYPAMTKKSIHGIIKDAQERWPLGRISVIHRFGKLTSADQIVFVGVTSPHRQAAFESAHFIMDFMKTRAPFWKKEHDEQGSHWVEARQTDESELAKWQGSTAVKKSAI